MLYKDEWLSHYFKAGVYCYQKSNQSCVENISADFIYTKIASQNQLDCNDLIRKGFNLIETSLLFEQEKSVADKLLTLQVDFVKPEEQSDVVNIAKSAFAFSCFHQDDHISISLANQIKADWVANYFLGKRGDSMIVARINKRVAGFLLLINHTTIDLIAVSSRFLRKGVASQMITFANQKIGLLKAGTQITNQSSIALYEKSGFFLKQSSFVLHKFLENKIYEAV